MKFLDFQRKMAGFPIFETKELRVLLGDEWRRTMLLNLKNWTERGHLVMFRRGLYGFSEALSREDVLVAATKLYSPSYVSLEAALSFYGIIPEAVFLVTSITARKTKRFKTPIGEFQYRKVKREAFGGFETRKSGGISFNIALPEKALVDFFYLNRHRIRGEREEFAGYRLNEDFVFDKKKLEFFSEAFRNKKVSHIVGNFLEYYVAR